MGWLTAVTGDFRLSQSHYRHIFLDCEITEFDNLPKHFIVHDVSYGYVPPGQNDLIIIPEFLRSPHFCGGIRVA